MAEISAIQKHWIINPDDLNKKYQVANQRAVDALQTYGSSKVIMQDDGSLSYPSDVALEDRKQGPLPEHLSINEELLLRRYYEGKIQEICTAFQFPNKVLATGTMFFKKFYQKWSIMEHDPKKIMLVCIYLACAVEDNFVSSEEFGRGLQEDPDIFYEYLNFVVESVEFNLMVYPPYRPIQGFIYYLEPFVQHMGLASLQALEELQGVATFYANKMMLTNAPLHYPSGQLALAALRMANKDKPKVDFEGYLQTLPNQGRYSELIANLDAIEQLVKAEIGEPFKIVLSHIDRKLRCCRNSGLLQRR